MSYISVFIAGLVTFLSPCIIPLMPLYLSMLLGEETVSLKILLRQTTGFLLGIMTIFVAFGLTFTSLARFLFAQGRLLEQIGGLIIILFALQHLGILKFSFLSKGRQFKVGKNRFNFLSAYLIGLAFSFGWTPCVGTVLGTVLLLLSQEATVLSGGLYMVVFTLGFSVLFYLSALVLYYAKGAFQSPRLLMLLKYFTGLIMLALGILLFLGKINRITAYFLS